MSVSHVYTLAVADGTATTVVRPSDWNSVHVMDISMAGHTLGSAKVSGTQVVFNGGNNITISGDTAGSQIVFSAAPTVVIADPTHTVSSGSVVFSNSNGVSFGLNGSTMTASVAPSATLGIADSVATVSAGVVQFSNSNGISFGLNGSTMTANVGGFIPVASSASFAGTSAGITGAGGVTGSITMNTAGIAISLSELALSRFVPYELIPTFTATSSAGQNTLHLFPFVLPTPVSFGQIDMIHSISQVSQFAPNTVQASVSSNSTMSLNYQASITASKFIDVYLFSRGAGVLSTNLINFASTENMLATFMSMTVRASVNQDAASLSGQMTMLSSYSNVISLPGLTSNTQTSINAASTVTTWGTAMMSLSGSTTFSTSTSGLISTTFSVSGTGAFPSTTMFSSYQMMPILFGSSLSPGEYWVGLAQRSSSSSVSASTAGNFAAGNSLSFTVNASVFTSNAGVAITTMGMTSSIAGSLGWAGSGTRATMAPQPGHGSFTTTYATNSTYVNNLGQASGAIALSQINTNVSFWRPWMEFASIRV